MTRTGSRSSSSRFRRSGILEDRGFGAHVARQTVRRTRATDAVAPALDGIARVYDQRRILRKPDELCFETRREKTDPFVQLQEIKVERSLKSLAAISSSNVVGPATALWRHTGISRPSGFIPDFPCTGCRREDRSENDRGQPHTALWLSINGCGEKEAQEERKIKSIRFCPWRTCPITDRARVEY
jgi:hypothetical protein